MTRSTYLERRWPDPPLFQQFAGRWCQDQARLLLDLVWQAYDLLLLQDLSKVPFSDDDEAKEESLNSLLAIWINQCMSGYEPFCIQHQPPEQTKRIRGKGRSPQPDSGFVLRDCKRTIWPLEGKVLAHEQDIGPYLDEINNNFLTGRYATFSSEGAMLGYLLHGNPEQTFAVIGIRLGQTMTPHPHFPGRPHRISSHWRQQAPGSKSPAREFTCHHLLLRIPTGQSAATGR